MLLDSYSGMKASHKILSVFLQTETENIDLPADVSGSPEPYEKLLRGLRVVKSAGRIHLRIDEREWLVLSGSTENLKTYISYFEFKKDEEGNHHHPAYAFEGGEPKKEYLSADSLNLIIELDSEYIEERGKC